MSTTAQDTRALATGRWKIDPAHSEVSFVARHLMVSKVRGGFTAFSGELHVAKDPSQSSVVAKIHTASVDTRQHDRDAHLRSDDFLHAERHPTMRFHSTALRPHRDGVLVSGELTIRGVTRPVDLAVALQGITEAAGDTRAAFSATAQLDRRDFGVGPSSRLDGGVALGDRVDIELEVQAVRAEVAS